MKRSKISKKKCLICAYLSNFLWKPHCNFRKIPNSLGAFHTQNWVKSGQNWPKFKNSENWEKMQFFHVSITFVALELDSPAQIEKKWIFDFFIFSWQKKPRVRRGGFKKHAHYLRNSAVFSRIDHFRSQKTRGSSSNWKKLDFWKMKK